MFPFLGIQAAVSYTKTSQLVGSLLGSPPRLPHFSPPVYPSTLQKTCPSSLRWCSNLTKVTLQQRVPMFLVFYGVISRDFLLMVLKYNKNPLQIVVSAWWPIPGIPAAAEAEVQRLKIQGRTRQFSTSCPNTKTKRARDVTWCSGLNAQCCTINNQKSKSW